MATMTPTILAAGVSGKAGNVVFVNTAKGMYIRPRVRPRDPQTPAQQASRDRMAKAARAWSDLPEEAFAAWTRYAKSLQSFNRTTGRLVAPRAMNLFSACYGKLLQIDPEAAPPLTPPSRTFTGDGLSLSLALSEGAVVVGSSTPNCPNVTTELLLQPLPGRNCRTYAAQYRSAAFHTFTAESPSIAVSAKAGWIAVAVRFVDTLTGQVSALVELGKVHGS